MPGKLFVSKGLRDERGKNQAAVVFPQPLGGVEKEER